MNIASLGLCRKAGGLITGFDAVIKAAEDRKTSSVYYAFDVSEKTKKELMFYCRKYNIPSECYGFSMDEIEKILKKRVGVFALTDEKFRRMLGGS